MPAKICVPVVGPTFQEAQRQLVEACAVGDLVEIWVEKFDRRERDFLIQAATVPVILKSESGRRSVDRFVDGPAIEALHDYDGLPNDLGGWVKQAGSIRKIACYCHTGVEALRLAQLASEDTLAVGMGPNGILTRLVAPLCGSPFTYAALAPGLESAPGQPTVEQLETLFGYRRLGASTKIFGLVGERVAAGGCSVVYHNARFCQENRDAVYVPISVPKGQLGAFFEVASSFPIVGLSVTTPHKVDVMNYLDEIDETASAIGAVNTVVRHNGIWKGTNTDAAGALEALGPVAQKRLVVLGAGGAARAIVYEAIQQGALVTVMNRTASRAHALASEMGCACAPMGPCKADIIVQATSAGMDPKDLVSPIPANAIPRGCVSMEIIIAQNVTPFMQAASARGCHVISGQAMFEAQARLQQIFWLTSVS